MKILSRMEWPVLAFAVCILVGLAMEALTGDWFWAALALIAGLIAGDLVEGVTRRVSERREPRR